VVSQARGLRTSQTRRFAPPWSVEETEACFIVRDAGGQVFLCMERARSDRHA
jgi:hypothetical protein